MGSMKSGIVLGFALALLEPTAGVGQDTPAVTIVPDSQFCNLVADDSGACQEALITLASARMVPAAFAELVTAAVSAGGDSDAEFLDSGEPVTFSGRGTKQTRPFELAGGHYEVTVELGERCDAVNSLFELVRTDGEYFRGGDFWQSGYAYGLEGSRYFWRVEAGGNKCTWTVTATPLNEGDDGK